MGVYNLQHSASVNFTVRELLSWSFEDFRFLDNRALRLLSAGRRSGAVHAPLNELFAILVCGLRPQQLEGGQARLGLLSRLF